MPRQASTAGVIDAVGAASAAHSNRTVWIGIDGFGAAGKTTLAARVAAADARVQVVHVDDFPPVPGFPEWNWDRFTTQVVEPLTAGRPSRYQVWHWGHSDGAEWVDVPPGRVVVVEGVSSTRREVAVPWDLTVWVNAPAELRLERALGRDGEALREVWLTEWIPPELAYADRERPRTRVDLIVDGTDGSPDLGESAF